MSEEQALPYAGQSSEAGLRCADLRVVEFTHRVMGFTCGIVLADLGAEVTCSKPAGWHR